MLGGTVDIPGIIYPILITELEDLLKTTTKLPFHTNHMFLRPVMTVTFDPPSQII